VTYLSNNDNNHISIDIAFIALSLILTVMTAPLFRFSTFLCCQKMGLSARKQDNCG
jgi:high-affinity K+ transport system ATPase subunit B